MSLRRALEAREGEQRRVGASTMARTEVEARIDILGSGESRTAINFPVVFSEKPIFTFGGELDDNHTPEAAAYPVISVMVLGWQTQDRGDDRVYYVGCDVGVVALGKERQRVIAHCLFKGLAFRGPSAGRRGL